jgi:small-conductance mechanosensitive channel
VDDLWTMAQQNASWLAAFVIVLLAAMGGQLFRTFALERLAVMLERRTASTLDEDIIRSLRRPVVLWATLGGFYLALLVVHLDPDVAELGTDVLSSVLIISITLWFAEVVVRLLVAIVPARPGQASPVTGVVQNVVRIFIMLVGLVLLLGNFGISVAPMLTTLGIGGLAVALGLQETLANVFAGMQLTIARNIRVGDILRLGDGEEAVLEDIGWRATRVRRLLTNATVIVPNAKLANDVITNFDLPTSEVGVLVDVQVHYRSDLEQVEAIACTVGREIMADVEGSVPTHAPFVRYRRFADSGIELTLHLRAVGFRESLVVRHECIKRLAARFAREGIVIPYPIYAINFDQERAGAPEHHPDGSAQHGMIHP